MQTFNSVVKFSLLFLSSFTCCRSCEDKDTLYVQEDLQLFMEYLGSELDAEFVISILFYLQPARINLISSPVAMKVKPESVHITSEVKEETTLQLTCMGNIGNPSGDFSWHLCNETNCKPLTGNNIKLGDIEKVPGSCQYYGSSTLTFNHSEESSPFYIQCLVTYHNDRATYNVIAQKRFDYSVTSVQEDQQNDGSIFIRIAVDAAMLYCAAILIVVICLVKKKKKIKEGRKLENEEEEVDALIS